MTYGTGLRDTVHYLARARAAATETSASGHVTARQRERLRQAVVLIDAATVEVRQAGEVPART